MILEKFRHSKIVATVGPACETTDQLRELIDLGVNIFRLNMSHGTHIQHEEFVQKIRKVSRSLKIPVGILADLQGPKIRIGEVENNGIELFEGDQIIVSVENLGIGNKQKIYTNHIELPNEVQINNKILIDDGLIELVVTDLKEKEVHCRVIVGGVLKSNKGMNLPYASIKSPALTEKDKRDLNFLLDKEIDFIALSFVRESSDLAQIRQIIQDNGKNINVIAKIEKPEAVENIDQIINEAYGIMVARGDLGVEIEPEEVPAVQKSIIKKCIHRGKPVIVATQMLDSMIRNPRPTRAETSDVANAILDGASAVMLSGETASGKYPMESVSTMKRVIKATENRFVNQRSYEEKVGRYKITTDIQGVCYSAVNLANILDAKMIVCITRTGRTAQQIARYRSQLPVFAITNSRQVVRKLCLTWGVFAFYLEREIDYTPDFFQEVDRLIIERTNLENNDLVMLTATMPTKEPGSTNMINVHRIKKS